MKYPSLFFSLFLCLLALWSCSNGDDSLYDENDSTDVSISAKMSADFDSIKTRLKTDTVYVGDTVIFIAEVNPSKSIRMQNYYWTLDDEYFASEFSFRKPIQSAGHHTVKFVLVDFFGDTLSDSLSIWAGNKPTLDDSVFIPATGTQELSTQGGITFAWNANDPDSIYQLHHHFQLQDQNFKTIVDTITHNSSFTYSGRLSSLQQYFWQVVSFNEIGLVSKDTLSSFFYTKGVDKESGIMGSIAVKSNYIMHFNALVSVYDTTGKQLIQDTINGYTSAVSNTNNQLQDYFFSFAPLKPGTYKIHATIPDYPIYQYDTITVTTKPNEVYNVGTLSSASLSHPTFYLLPDTKADTIDFADTLILTWDSLEIPDITFYQFSVNLENKNLMVNKGKDGKAIIVLPKSAKSIRYTILTITMEDMHQDKVTKTYYIRPSFAWFEHNKDTTLYNGDILQIFIKDTNPYGFTPETFLFKFPNTKDTSIIKPTLPTSDYDLLVTSASFTNIANPIKVGITYTNGVTQWATWTLYRSFEPRSNNE